MPSAEIVAIGTELLLGETLDTNTQFLAHELNKAGFDVFRSTVIGDNQHRITQVIAESLSRSDIVITAGGLGPTLDDPTRQAAANVFNIKLVFKKNLWGQIKKRFEKAGRIPTKNNRRQAYLPSNAKAIENPVGTAPAFYIQNNSHLLICLPGIPAEMKTLFNEFVLPLLFSKYQNRLTILSLIIHTAGLGESKVDEMISDLEQIENPTVGLTAYPGQVDIRITAKAEDAKTANKLILPILNELEKRLGNNIFGKNDDKLTDKVKSIKEKTKKPLVLYINNHSVEINEEIIQSGIFDKVHRKFKDAVSLENEIHKMYNISNQNSAGFDLAFDHNKTILQLILMTSNNLSKETKNYMGHQSLISQWALNSFFDFLRRNLS
jgi:nicotinamide-nucleotide amidase